MRVQGTTKSLARPRGLVTPSLCFFQKLALIVPYCCARNFIFNFFCLNVSILLAVVSAITFKIVFLWSCLLLCLCRRFGRHSITFCPGNKRFTKRYNIEQEIFSCRNQSRKIEQDLRDFLDSGLVCRASVFKTK